MRAGTKGKDTVYVMAHGDDGWIQLGKDGLHKDNAEKWAPLSWKVSWQHYYFGLQRGARQQGDDVLFQAGRYTSSFTAADSTQKHKYIALPFGILPSTFGSWEGRVHTWGPDGNWFSSYEE